MTLLTYSQLIDQFPFSKVTKNNLESKASLWRTGTAEPVVDIKESLEEPPILGKQVTPLPRLEKLFDLEMNGDINKVLWDPRLDMGKIVSINETAIHVWLLNDQMGSAQLSNSIKLSLAGENRLPLTTGTWNPHAPEIAVGQLDSVQGWDLRSRSQTFNIPKAHSILVRALDFNPNKTYQIASGGDDCKVKFWDLRNPTNAIKEISEHSHWVWSVAYNRFHDQLFLSAGSDCQVNLHSIVSFSSAAYNFIDKEDSIKHESDEDDEGDDNEREKTPKPTDGLVRTYDQHEESVYGVAWSPYDAWVFCSLSYDGRAVVNRVPREEKYKILL
ncbi:hypothetical protein G9A89_013744 [Geosiphon pyriformis]|nr:hypothetical protein G9A89_013744 [Geosiphon pyriformis]